MVIRKIAPLLTATTAAIHKALSPLQSRSVQELIEPPAIVDPDSSASKIIGIMRNELWAIKRSFPVKITRNSRPRR